MHGKWKWAALTVPAALFAAAVAMPDGPASASGSPRAAQYTAKGELIFPADYRHWTYLSSGIGMSYSAEANAAPHPPFDSVFADPAAERAFRATGHWPEGSVLIVEVRGSTSQGSINQHGSFQSGEPIAIEAHVRDSKRFKGGWGFFGFEGRKPSTLIPYKADCYSCHLEHAAVDTTFVQFYPTLLPIAVAKKTFSKAYLAEEKAAAKH